MTLTFALLTPQSNQHIYEPKNMCDELFRVIVYKPTYIGDQNWMKFPLGLLVFRYGVHMVFATETHTLIHRRARPNTVCLRHRFSTVAEA